MTSEVWVVRPATVAGAPRPERCLSCDGRGGMLAPEEAAALTGVSPRIIYRWVEAGRVHFAEGSDGSLFVCLVSLPRAAD